LRSLKGANELTPVYQETIALYEERLSNSEAHRYELEDAVKSLEDQVKKSSEPISPAVIAARATTAAQIDNQTLHEQVTHLQKKVTTLEEQLDDARSAQERDEQAVMARITRFRDNEIQFRKDLAEARRQNDEISKAEVVARARVEEVTEALRESDLALEDARAEIETLRVEVSVSATFIWRGAPIR
jgi:CAP-Gly domain-containing linker protein 1